MTRKFLLLTDIPPNKSMTGGLFLNDMVRLLPQGSLAVFATVHPFLGDYTLSPDLEGVTLKSVAAPYGRGRIRTIHNRLGSKAATLSSYLLETFIHNYHLPRLVEQATAYAREMGTEAIWTLLQSPLMWRIARRVAANLDVPLYSFVMDPPDWWLEYNLFDPYWRRRLIHEYEESIRQSTAVGCGSWNMAREYQAQYGTRAVPMVPSLPASSALPPATAPHDRETFIIGLAGQLYAATEWRALLHALGTVNWQIGGRKVVLRLMGSINMLNSTTIPNGPVNIEFMGWRSQAEVINLLADADACYCPYRFGEKHANEARLAYPGKLTNYLATGRPVLFHGPNYSSPGQFLAKYDAGVLCHSLEPDAILAQLETLISDNDRYAKVARNGTRAFHEALTLAVQRRSVAEFVDMPLEALRTPQEFI